MNAIIKTVVVATAIGLVGCAATTAPQQKETEIPTFKEHLNLLEKISNRKLEKVKHPGTTEEKTKEKKGFFRRLFKKKEAK